MSSFVCDHPAQASVSQPVGAGIGGDLRDRVRQHLAQERLGPTSQGGRGTRLGTPDQHRRRWPAEVAPQHATGGDQDS
ncbi:hypothetical protein [Amycolatopsis sp. lyj-108]|uniref:hypothetical protein n=1 Tax=Amycolatopsis sp. lyj-108 TaxID=2789286 RepID=UPI00397AAE96